MKKFKFRLQTLLNIREAREREIQHELAAILRVQNREREKQEELRRRIEEQKTLFGDKLRRGAYSSSEAILFERFVDVSLRAIDTAEERIKSMEPQIQEVRKRLIEASRARKVVEKLKERKLAQHNYEVNKEINKEIDEMNQKLFQMRKRESA
ncbi:MAG: flagellar export protein FliJ [Spirochaetes bacterium RBG_13_51_14]|nr:MAG: flagellar export protein FliJ [Spirochaetes bacterium RBG_13_51_14]